MMIKRKSYMIVVTEFVKGSVGAPMERDPQLILHRWMMTEWLVPLPKTSLPRTKGNSTAAKPPLSTNTYTPYPAPSYF
jgi:hypothetical protein